MIKQKEAAIRDFDEKLAKFGYHANSANPKKSDRKKTVATGPEPSKPASNPKS